MTTPKISIIIPVYNTEKYLDACIDSLVNQTFKDCEFIFINDGSIDSSSEILNKLASKDTRVIVINQGNQGVSIARNNGLKIARGKYIGFVDADDWVENDMYQILYDEIEFSYTDLVMCNSKCYQNGDFYVSGFKFPQNKILDINFIKKELLPYLIKHDDLYSLWNKLYKASIIKQYGILFPEGNALSEDNIFNMLYFNKIKTLKYINYIGYNYRDTEDSATRNIFKMDYFKNYLDIYKFNYRSYMDLVQTDEEINKLKSEKFIKNTISLINIYFQPSKKVGFFKRYNYVKSITNNEEVINTINNNFEDLYKNENRFGKFMLTALKQRSILKLFLASKYSILRN